MVVRTVLPKSNKWRRFDKTFSFPEANFSHLTPFYHYTVGNRRGKKFFATLIS